MKKAVKVLLTLAGIAGAGAAGFVGANLYRNRSACVLYRSQLIGIFLVQIGAIAFCHVYIIAGIYEGVSLF